ncbi:MAG: hypothetical protein IJT26_08310 [Bacteroidales bacterium]|nr:hypothetical protein [Bacteroidales bacterium]
MSKISKSITFLALAAALCSSCVTFSRNESPRLSLPELAFRQVNAMVAAPVSALNIALSGADSAKFKVRGSFNPVTLPDPSDRIRDCHMVIQCIGQDIWQVYHNVDSVATVYRNFTFLSQIDIVERSGGNTVYRVNFTGQENDQNGFTATVANSRQESLTVDIAQGASFTIGYRNTGANVYGASVFETFHNGESLDVGRISYSGAESMVKY